MKKVKISIIAMMAVMIMVVTAGLAQEHTKKADTEGKGRHGYHHGKRDHERMMLPDLSDDQRANMKDLRISLMKQMLPLKNKLEEKNTQLHSLSTTDSPDMKKINSLIEEIGSVKVDMMKLMAVHKQEIRKQLTEDQRIVFDSYRGNRMKHGMNFK